MVSSFEPAPPEKSVKIKFHRILDEATQQLLEDRFIVLIKVKKGPIGTLFMDQDGKSYHRLDGQTRKYAPEEYHEELILRNTQKESFEEYVKTNGKPPEIKKPEPPVENKTTSQTPEKGEILNDIKNYEPFEEQQQPFENEGDYLGNCNYPYEQQADVNQGALDEAEGWCPEMYIGAENYYPGPPMGECFREFVNSQPFFFPQQMYPQQGFQQNFGMIFPQGQFFAQFHINAGGNPYCNPSMFHQQFQNGPIYDAKAEEEDDITVIRQLEEMQLRELEQQQQQEIELQEKERKEIERKEQQQQVAEAQEKAEIEKDSSK
mgnify:FL=1